MTKINRSRSFAKNAMVKKHHTRDRIEELAVCKFFEKFIPKHYSCIIKYQDTLPDLIPLDGADLTGDRRPTVDITLTFEQKRFAIRLMGKIHEESQTSKIVRKDNFQKLVLENQPIPWIVIDIFESESQNIYFLKSKLNLTNLIAAYDEMYSKLCDSIPLVSNKNFSKVEPFKEILSSLLTQFKSKTIKTNPVK